MKNINKKIIMMLLTLLIFIVIMAYFYKDKSVEDEVQYTEFIRLVNEGTVEKVFLSDNPKIKFVVNGINYITDNPRNDNIKEDFLLKNIIVVESYSEFNRTLQGILLFVFVIFMFYFTYKNQKNTGKSALMASKFEACNEVNFLKFKDVAGNVEAKESVADIVDFIKDPEKYNKYGAKMPKGIIFYGPPGTGKTLLAKAMAGEAGVPFFSVCGSDFVQMYVGVGAGRIRDLFKKARDAKKAVIFIDEIDAIGKSRNNSAAGANDEREQTLNALLTEMSGFNNTDGVVVVAATNRLDILDDALLRPGRFDRQVEIGLPDSAVRKKILLHYSRTKPLSTEVNIDKLAKETVYFSGAMLENLLNEAAICAAKSKKDFIDNHDIENSYFTIIAGSEKKDRTSVKENEKKLTAYHEAGHGLVAKLMSPENTVSRISIIPSTKGAGGFCINIPPDKMYYTKKELEAQIMVNLAGRAAEELIFGTENVTTGASNDFEKTKQLIKDYIIKYGMGKDPSLMFSKDESKLSYECGEVLKELYNETKDLLIQNIDCLESIAVSLFKNETLNEEQLNECLNNVV